MNELINSYVIIMSILVGLIFALDVIDTLFKVERTRVDYLDLNL